MSSPAGEGNSFGALLDQVMFGPGSASLGSANIMDPAFVDSAKTARQRADEAVVEAQKKAMEACARAQDAANKATLAGGSGFVFNAEQINTVIDELEQTILPH